MTAILFLLHISCRKHTERNVRAGAPYGFERPGSKALNDIFSLVILYLFKKSFGYTALVKIKLDFYKHRLVQDYMYAAFVEEFEEYVEKHKDSLTQEQIEESRPTRMTDEEIIENLITVEMGYIAALEADVPINYAIAQTQMTNLYANNLYVLKSEDKDSDLYKSAKEFVDQIALIAKGMDISVDEYLVELSRDSMKSMAITMIEDRWQTEFRNSNFDGTIDEYIDYCYEVLKQKYTVVMYGLE